MASECGDFNFANDTIRVREKKHDHSKTVTFRHVHMHPRLKQAMQEWFEGRHPGGRYSFCDQTDVAMTSSAARSLLEGALRHSKWDVIQGWHTIRHSFISICAMRGVPQTMIDAWVGHETEEQKRRYRHLFPKAQANAMGLLFVAGAEVESPRV